MIKLRNVTKIYEHRELPALKDVSLDVQDGEYISIMGQSGSGKSTLLNIIGTMDYLTSGEYYYNDIAVHEMKGDKLHEFRRKHVGFVFQNYALMKSYTVFENVELPLLAGTQDSILAVEIHLFNFSLRNNILCKSGLKNQTAVGF